MYSKLFLLLFDKLQINFSGRNPSNFWVANLENRWLHKIILTLADLYEAYCSLLYLRATRAIAQYCVGVFYFWANDSVVSHETRPKGVMTVMVYRVKALYKLNGWDTFHYEKSA